MECGIAETFAMSLSRIAWGLPSEKNCALSNVYLCLRVLYRTATIILYVTLIECLPCVFVP